MRAARGVWALVAVALCSAAAVYVVRYQTIFGWYPTHDLYAYFYPKALYALASLADGGRGLLWNPYQNCGQPFLALPQTGVWYPVYLLFLVFRPDTALQAVLLAHLVIGGVGTFALGRALGARPLAALVGALAFEMGNAMVSLTVWSPMHCAPLAWMPWALWGCERLLRAPSLSRALVLAVVLTISILPGWPQTVFMTYQLIGLRVLWELLTRRSVVHAAPLCLLALGLPLLLAAVELLPELEVAAQSLRSLVLGSRELSARGQWGWTTLQSQLRIRSTQQPFLLVPMLASAAALVTGHTRRVALFYASAGCLAAALGGGPGSPVYDLYSHLPLATLFRQPVRFLWLTSFCLSVLAALGTEALATLHNGRLRSLAVIGAAALILVAFHLATPRGLTTVEWAAAGLVLLAGLGGLSSRGVVTWAPLVVAAALLFQLIGQPATNATFLMPSPPQYFAADDVVQTIRPLLGPGDRVHMVHRHPDLVQYRLMPKTASLLRVPSISDYEPMATQRYAEFLTFMQTGKPLQSLNQFLYSPTPRLRGWNRRLLDLISVRYLVVDTALVSEIEEVQPPFRRVTTAEQVSVFENPQRLPRAFHVPRIEVVADPSTLLLRLATGNDDLRQVAFVEHPPVSGFLGSAAPAAPASVQLTRNEPEHVSLTVDAAAPGFVVLTDQYFPGWSATVNGTPATVERANYAFRLIEVPQGSSTVEFRYTARRLWVGAAISALSMFAVGLLLWRTRAHATAP